MYCCDYFAKYGLDISSSEKWSSGGPKLFIEDGELRVFGIVVGSFYDAPNSGV